MNFDNRTDPYWYYNNSLYNHHKRPIIGGVITESKKITEKLSTDNVNDLEEVLRRYEKGLNDIEKGLNYDDEDEQERDKEQLENMIETLKNRIETLNNENKDIDIYDFDYDDEPIEEQLLNDEMLYSNFISELNTLDKKIYDDKNYTKKDYIEYIELMFKLYNLSNKPEYKVGYVNTVDEYEKKYNENYPHHKDDTRMYRENYDRALDSAIKSDIKDRRIYEKSSNITTKDALGDGTIFEDFLKDNKSLLYNITNDDSEFINNNNNSIFKNMMVKFNGKNKPLSELYIYDASQDNTDIEIKYWTDRFTDNEIKKDGLILQTTKFGNNNFTPYFKYDDNNNLKLFNVWSKDLRGFVNPNNMKDLYVVFKTIGGLYSYHLNNDPNLILNKAFDDKDGKPIYTGKLNKKIWDDDLNAYVYKINPKQIKKI